MLTPKVSQFELQAVEKKNEWVCRVVEKNCKKFDGTNIF